MEKRSMIHVYRRHDVHPLSMLIITFTYIFVVASFHSYAFIEMMPLSLYPITMIVFYRLSIRHIKNILLASLPFITAIGVSQLFFIDERISFFHWHIEAGWLAFTTLVIKNTLAILAATVLFLTIPIEQLAGALLSLHIPRLLVVQLLLTYRYIFLFLEEAKRLRQAYMLRAPHHRAIQLSVWGSLVGHLLLRTFERAERVHEAMTLRRFSIQRMHIKIKRWTIKEMIYTFVVVGLFIAYRLVVI
ncbi:energy-coupling factor transporter transmembrane protein EcfT [Anoxybacillus sp. LAT_35]|nr:energy-coupling factor transporter transmembrane protein EcfT [Anoxybacillus sp. LAT_11]MCG6173679.1 energy-coupling factor transporter transmembrane protein EcfT [Anoxybacillus sp. LAT_11]MCG6173760.1 energy-coupling factor transporter transmembrane protein EcfT [Anoxybacillus sp. LAT_31]MCG6178086.1 energy-coupling factor transporter transmembrane protein EcfT [Anoxybacillus sp. LAT_35]MCG6181001.1 energy-coupling factor transporter transmembrane protein EcfT [Anoxybacillus sp. LAT_33]